MAQASPLTMLAATSEHPRQARAWRCPRCGESLWPVLRRRAIHTLVLYVILFAAGIFVMASLSLLLWGLP